MTRISIVVPAYNEEEVLPVFYQRLVATVSSLEMDVEILFVNDGSKDRSLEVMKQLREADARIGILDLSRNFGKEIALSAGLDHAAGDAVIIIDADLQDPPELIATLIKHWREGFDTVYAQRLAREGEGVIKRFTAHLFYRVIKRASRVEIPQDTGDYRLLSRRAVEAVRQLREQHPFMKGLFAWIGYPRKAVPYRRDRRYAGETKWNYWRLWNLAMEGITSFTIAPMKIATYVGLMTALMAFGAAGLVILKKLVYGDPVAGYPSLMVVILFLGGVQLMSIGVLGEYLGRVFDEVKQRPLYLVNGYAPPARER